ncbi:MAG: hypothetical protein AAF329_03385 [Cyanobacteria bacterium P01_A01_bin.17]
MTPVLVMVVTMIIWSWIWTTFQRFNAGSLPSGTVQRGMALTKE